MLSRSNSGLTWCHNAVFRDQDFAKLPIDQALEVGRYFGRIHIHPTSGAPKGYPGVHLVYRDTDLLRRSLLERHTNSVIWHSDVSYEEQAPGTTFLYLLDGPITGGDTLFCNTAKAYELLSPDFRRRLHGLKAVHSGFGQAQSSIIRGSFVRQDPTSTEHPIVRTHPVCYFYTDESWNRANVSMYVGHRRESSLCESPM